MHTMVMNLVVKCVCTMFMNLAVKNVHSHYKFGSEKMHFFDEFRGEKRA